jgi:hypothetical protein
MTSEVEESSAPTTPTLSSVAPSDVSLDDLQPLTDASSQVSDDELELHPTLFIREDMVSIRVRNIRMKLQTALTSCFRSRERSSGSPRSTSHTTLVTSRSCSQSILVIRRCISGTQT